VRVSNRTLTDRNQRQAAQIERLTAELETCKDQARADGNAVRRAMTELSAAKDVIAMHIVAAKHPSSALTDAHSMGVALQEALAAIGVDIRIELARMEGSDL
jgi:hypothetical protein